MCVVRNASSAKLEPPRSLDFLIPNTRTETSEWLAATEFRREAVPGYALHAWHLPTLAHHVVVPWEKDSRDAGTIFSPDGAAIAVNLERGAKQEPARELRVAFTRGVKIGEQRMVADSLRQSGFWWQPGRAATPLERKATSSTPDPYLVRAPVSASHPAAAIAVYVEGGPRLTAVAQCAGVLIDRRRVLTAFHCVSDQQRVVHRQVRVVFGVGFSWSVTMWVKPEDVFLHPGARYVRRADMYANDLALLRLPADAPLEMTPARLPLEKDVAVGDRVLVVGYGGDHDVGLLPQNELRMGWGRVVAFSDSIPNTIRNEAAVGSDNGGCFGDSGGPLLKQRADGTWVVVGVHWGLDSKDYARACGNVGLSGDLRRYRAWLEHTAAGAR
jgi:V8-like Glu-specific endopeptidase